MEKPKVENTSQKTRFLLTREFAEKRSKVISVEKYILFFYFKENKKRYKVKTSIDFFLRDTEGIFLECAVESIFNLSINDFSLDGEVISQIWQENSLMLPSKYLKNGKNNLKILSVSTFGQNCSGFHKVTKNNFQICYTVCPPNYAHQIFPCFDQPDLKAKYKITVSAPNNWTIISTNFPSSETLKDDRKITKFPETLPLSSYLFSLVVGNFISVEPFEETRVPMRIFASPLKKMELEKMKNIFFEQADKALQFYEKFFNTPFPFEKYDQIFVPEFKYNGMENPGSVLLTETFLKNVDISSHKTLNFLSTVTHELSHMWFGDLVTFKWWDDIWLNEGFASFIGHYALKNTNPQWEQDVKVKFFYYKNIAAHSDASEMSHPVLQNVVDTEVAESIFDSITYNKGSGVIQNLMYILTENLFSKCLERYFKKFAWKNATSKDFHETIVETSKEMGENLDEKMIYDWIEDWIHKEGCLSIDYEFTISENNQLIINLSQRHRPSRVTLPKTVAFAIGIFSSNCLDEVRIIDYSVSRCIFKEGTTKISINLFPNTKKENMALVLNYDGHAYAECLLDSDSHNFLMKYTEKIDPLIRAQMLLTMINKTEKGLISPFELYLWIKDRLRQEKNSYNFSECLTQANKFLVYLSDAQREACCQIIFEEMFSIALEYNKNPNIMDPDEFLQIQEAIAHFIYDDQSALKLWKWAQCQHPDLSRIPYNGFLYGIAVENGLLRNIFSDIALQGLNKSLFKSYISYQQFYLGSTRDPQKKADIWLNFVNRNLEGLSQFDFISRMRGFNNRYDPETQNYHKLFFDVVGRVFESYNLEYAEQFYENLYPKNMEPYLQILIIDKIIKKKEFKKSLQDFLIESKTKAEIARTVQAKKI